MKYFKHLYISENLVKKKERLIRKLEKNKLQLNLYLVTLPETKQNQLEIIGSEILFQPSYPKKDLFVIGMFSGYDEAVGLVETLAHEVYVNGKGQDIRDYILKKEQEG